MGNTNLSLELTVDNRSHVKKEMFLMDFIVNVTHTPRAKYKHTPHAK